MVTAATLSTSAAAQAAAQVPDEAAALEAAQQWVKAVTMKDVELQMRLLPSTMFPKEGDRERARAQRLHQKEMATIRRQKYTMFVLGPPVQSLKVGLASVVVIPYKSVLENNDGKLQTDSTLIAVALDGSKWSVFDGSGQNLRSLRTLIPGYTAGLNIPPAKSNVLTSE